MYGIKVNHDDYSSNEEMYAKLSSGSTTYDIVQPTDYIVSLMIRQGLLQKIDSGYFNDLGVNAFKMNNVDGSMSHSTRFVLVDGKRRIRGYYISADDGFPKTLLHDIRQVRSELP